MNKGYTFTCKLLLALFLLFSSLKTFAQPGNVFTHVTTTGISSGAVDNTAFAVSKSDNKMYVAFRDNANSGKLTVMQYTGSAWALLGNAGISQGAVNYSIGIATITTINGNEVYVAYSDAANGNRLTIMRWGGTSWVADGTAGSHSGDEASSINMTVANNGDMFVAYSDLGTGSKAFVKKRVSGTWTNIAGTGISAGIADDIDIACGNIDNQPYIVYKDASVSGKATVRKYNGTSWSTVGTTGFTSGTVSDCSIAVDRLNRPNISYNDGSVNNRATVRYYDGSTWQVLGFAGISSNIATYTSLVFDYDNNAYIIYKDNSASGKATVRKYNGTSWATVTTSGFSSSTADFTNIEFDNDQNIYVAYKDAGVSNKAVVQQLSCISPTTPSINSVPAGFSICAGEGIQLVSTASQNNTTYSWYQKLTGFEDVGDLTELNDNSNNSGAAFSSVVDANGNIYVVKMQTADSMIVVKRFAGGVWQTIGGTLGKSAGFTNRDATDIAFDADGNLYVAYIDFSGAKPIVVKKFVSNSWVDVGPAVTEGCLSASLHINSYGMMALATGKKNGSAYFPAVFINYGSGWIETPEISTTEKIGNIDVTIDLLGNIIVSYINVPFNLPLYDAGIPKAYKYNGISWSSLPLGLTENSYFINVNCDRDNNYYISTNSTGPSSAPSNYKVNVMRSSNQGTSWTNIGPTDLPELTGGNTLAIDNYGVPYLGFVSVVGGFSKYKLVKYVSAAWVNLFTTLENANTSQIDIFFDKSKNVPLLMEFHSTASIKKGNVYRIEKKFISTGGTRYTTIPGDYFLTADAGCNTSVTSSIVTITQTSATNNWTGTVSTEFNAAGNWSCGRIPLANDDIVLPAGAPRYPVLSAALSPNISIKKLTIQSGASLTLNGQNLNIASDLIINGTLDANTADSKITMNGTVEQTISGNSTSIAFNNLTISNAVRVNMNLTAPAINGTLHFTNGKLILGFALFVNNITGFNSDRFIVIPSGDNGSMLGQTIASGQSKIFPIGNAETSYTPVIVSHASNTSANCRLKVFNGTGPFTGSNAANYVNKRYRFLGADNIDYSFTFFWNTADENSSFNRNACGIATGSHISQNGYSAANIIDQTLPGAATIQSASTFSRTITGVRSLPAIGTTTFYKDMYVTSQLNLLPIQLLSFSAKLMNNNSTEIKWQISASSNPKTFIVERSSDGISFDIIGTVNGNTTNNNYQFIDNQITKTGYQYYRLKMTDLDGKTSFSNIAKVFINSGTLVISNVYPQPLKSNIANIVISAPEKANLQLQLTDITGRILISKYISVEKGENTVQLNMSTVNNGTYFISVISNNTKSNTLSLIKY